MPEKRVAIPATIGAATERLTTLGSIATATEWERAAIVYAHTANQQGSQSGSRKVVNRLGVKEFADLGIVGLKSQDTVRFYRERWAAHGYTDIEPGDSVLLPEVDWPGNEKDTDPGRGRVRISPTTPPAKVAEAVAALTPEQQDAVVDLVASDQKLFTATVSKHAQQTPAPRVPGKPELDLAAKAFRVLNDLDDLIAKITFDDEGDLRSVIADRLENMILFLRPDYARKEG